MDVTGALNLRLSMRIDDLLVHEHHLPLDGRVTIGRDLRGNVITWHKLPPSLTLLESHAGQTHLRPHPAVVVRLHRDGECKRISQDHAVILRRGDRAEIDLNGATLELQFFDPASMPHIEVPRALRAIDVSPQRNLAAGILATALAAQVAVMMLPSLLAPTLSPVHDATNMAPIAERSPAPLDAPPAREVAAHEESDVSVDDAEVAASVRPVVPKQIAKAQPQLEQDLVDLLDLPTGESLDAALADAARVDEPIQVARLSSAAQQERGVNRHSAELEVMATAQSKVAARGIDIGIKDIKRDRPARVVEPPPESDQQVYRGLIMAKRDQFRRCYESSLKSNTSLSGRITLNLRIEPVGKHSRIVSIEAGEDDVGGDVAACMSRVMSRMKLPLPSEETGAVTTAMAFVFSPN